MRASPPRLPLWVLPGRRQLSLKCALHHLTLNVNMFVRLPIAGLLVGK